MTKLDARESLESGDALSLAQFFTAISGISVLHHHVILYSTGKFWYTCTAAILGLPRLIRG